MEKPAPAAVNSFAWPKSATRGKAAALAKTSAQRECVVTGGLGTIEVTHNGKTYYVCCTGCRDYFNENAEKVLAELAAKNKGK